MVGPIYDYMPINPEGWTVRVILNMLLVIDSLPAFGTSKYEYREYTKKNFFFKLFKNF